MRNGRRRCWLGIAGSTLSAFVIGFGVGLPSAKEFGSFALSGRLLVAVAFAVVGMLPGFLVGLAQFCTED